MLKKQGPSGDTADFVRLPFNPAAASAACCVSVRHEINSCVEVCFFHNGWCMHISFLQPAGCANLLRLRSEEQHVQHARWIQEEMPVRLAHRLSDFLELPFVIVCNARFHEVHREKEGAR